MTLSPRKQAERAELLARAALVRPLIKEGHVDPADALYYVVGIELSSSYAALAAKRLQQLSLLA